MKSLIASIAILGIVGMVVGVAVQADTAPISATVTVKLISVTVDPTSVNYGTLAFGDSAISSTFTATNEGNIDEAFEIKGADATFNGGSWTLAGTSDTNQFRHTVTGVSPAIAEQSLTLSQATWSGTISADGTQTFTSKFYMPTAGSGGAGETATTNITVVATLP